jgi:bifunctional DNA-binding transcriptional regulator/antitoxin component of YhaV-PrlF toxin-antitoxin module
VPIAKFTKKGQITIPVEYKKRLGSEIVEITYEDDDTPLTKERGFSG